MRGIPANGDAIREARKVCGLTQDDLAARSGCTVRTIRNAENGMRLDANTLRLLAEVFELSISEISHSSSLQSELERHKKMVIRWREAFMQTDVKRVMSFHHANSVLELPGTEGMPAGGNFRGVEEIRDHYQKVFQVFQLIEVHQERLDAVENTVFHRSVGTVKSVSTGKTTTTSFFNEFEFTDGKISKRVCISDMSGMREILG